MQIHLNFCHLAKLAVATSNRIYGVDYASNMGSVSFSVSWRDSSDLAVLQTHQPTQAAATTEGIYLLHLGK